MNNKENILKCALELFSLKGYEGVGVQEIVDKANISKPTLYHYFTNKKGLLEAIVKEFSTNLMIIITKATRYNGDVSNTIFNTIEKFFEQALKNPEYYKLKMGLWFAPTKSEPHIIMKPYLELEHRIIEEMFKVISEDHGNMKDRHQQYALSFLGVINTYIGLGLNGYIKLDSQLIYKIQHQFLHGIYS